MPAADQGVLAVVGDFGDGRGDEVLVSEVGLDPAVDVLGDSRDLRCRRPRRGIRRGRSWRCVRLPALAAHVADEHPHRIRTSYDFVEIPADPGFSRSADVAGCQQERAEPARRRRQDRPLHDVGHAGHLRQPPGLLTEASGRLQRERGATRDVLHKRHVGLGVVAARLGVHQSHDADDAAATDQRDEHDARHPDILDHLELFVVRRHHFHHAARNGGQHDALPRSALRRQCRCAHRAWSGSARPSRALIRPSCDRRAGSPPGSARRRSPAAPGTSRRAAAPAGS